MVQLYIKEHTYSNTTRHIVKTERGRDIFFIDGKWGQKNNQLELFTMSGQPLITVTQKNLSVYPKFKVMSNQLPMGYIKKRPRLFRSPVYIVTKFGWRVTGDYEKREYVVKSKEEIIMTVDKALTTFGDFYSLDITKPSDAPLCAILAVLIDHYSINKTPERFEQQILNPTLQD